ncbi:hypothetical protein [Sphingomonas quercus]|nr:hypothetical protein [Sphingomonas quercus]
MDNDIHLNRTEARAGTTPRVTRYVLSISLAAVVIIFALLLFLWR